MTLLKIAFTLLLTWSPNIEPDFAGYKLYSGIVSRVYTNQQYVGNVTLLRFPAPDNITYYTLTAIDFSGNESGFSNEVVYNPITGIISPNSELEEMKAYPNPFTDMITFEGCETYKIYNEIGQWVDTIKNSWSPNVAAGKYYVEGITGGKVIAVTTITKL